MDNTEKLVRGEAAAKNEKNTVYHCDVDIAGDLIAGALLSQIVYYYGLPERKQTPKLRIFKDGYYWMAKGREDWKDEIRVTPKQFDRASTILESKGFIHIEKFKFNGSPTLHIRLDFEAYNRELTRWKEIHFADEGEDSQNGKFDFTQTGNSILPKGENPSSPNGNNDIPQTGKSLTVTTTGTTAVTTDIKKESVKESERIVDVSYNESPEDKSSGSGTTQMPYKQVADLYASICVSYPRLAKLSNARKKAIHARFNDGYEVEDFKHLFEIAESSSFLKGKNNRHWSATFDWMIKEANMAKVLEGNYSGSKGQQNSNSSASESHTGDKKGWGGYLC